MDPLDSIAETGGGGGAASRRAPSIAFDTGATLAAAATSETEARRVAALRALNVLDSTPEPEFDGLARAAAVACGVPISLLSLVDTDRQWFKANVGLPEISETPRDISFCSYAIRGDGLYEVRDATLDPLFAHNPLVTAGPEIRFYSGAPIALRHGERVGTLCVIDRTPKSLDARQREILTSLAGVAAHLLEMRQAMLRQADAAHELHAIDERARESNEEHLRRTAHESTLRDISAIAHAVPQIVWRASVDARVDWISDRFTEFTGMPPAAALGRGWTAVVPEDDRSSILAHFEHARRTGAAMSFTCRLWHAQTARYREVLARATPSLNGAQQLVGWIGTLTDVDDEHRATERDHRASEAFQVASLPQHLPHVPGLRFTADYQAAEAEWFVGGDWYDAFTLDDGRIVMSVGDVMGTGLDSAVTMAAVRQSIRGAAQLYPEPSAVLDAADRALKSEQPDRIVTAFVGIFEPLTRLLNYASAGHPPPLYRSPRGVISELRGTGLPLGLRSELTEYESETRTRQLDDGSLLVVYTDGLSEASRDMALGEARIRDAIEAALSAGADNLARFIRQTVLDVDPKDDVAVLTLSTDLGAFAEHTHDHAVQHWLLRADDPAAAMDIRRELTELLRLRGASADQTADAELIFGELLGNVVRHTTGEARVAIDLNNAYPVLHVLDRGAGFVFAARLPRDVMSESGRGLFIAAALARDLNVSLRPDGGSHARAVFRFRLKGAVRGKRGRPDLDGAQLGARRVNPHAAQSRDDAADDERFP